MCTECNLAFFLSPLKAGIVALSFTIALASLVALRRWKKASTKQRLSLLYVHVFAFVFPVFFFLFFRGCQSYFSGCDQAKAIAAMLGLTAFIATILAFALAPFIFVKRYLRKSVLMKGNHWAGFVKRHSEKLVLREPKLFVIDSAAPVAFSFSFMQPRIFLTVGLFELLGKKQIEAIILHELAHIKSRATFVKLSAHMARLLSPFSAMANFLGGSSVSDEETAADSFAAETQGTFSHLDSAKRKIVRYYSERKGYHG